MGILCDCVTPSTEGKFILLNYAKKTNEYNRAFTFSLKGINHDSCSTVNNSSRYSHLLECEKKKYDEQDERQENSHWLYSGKALGFNNRSGIFQEDTEVSNSNSNRFKLSNEKSRNKRIILLTNSSFRKEISSKLYINDDEILLSYDNLNLLDNDELIYQGPSVHIINEQQRVTVLIKLFKKFIQIDYNINSDKADVIYFEDVISVSKMLYKKDCRKKNANNLKKNIVFLFQINTCDCYYEFGCVNYGIGNALFKAIQFLQLKA